MLSLICVVFFMRENHCSCGGIHIACYLPNFWTITGIYTGREHNNGLWGLHTRVVYDTTGSHDVITFSPGKAIVYYTTGAWFHCLVLKMQPKISKESSGYCVVYIWNVPKNTLWHKPITVKDAFFCGSHRRIEMLLSQNGEATGYQE